LSIVTQLFLFSIKINNALQLLSIKILIVSAENIPVKLDKHAYAIKTLLS